MGVFAKVLLAIAILVANGVLLFVILRFLLWLAFPGKRDEEAAVAAARPAAGAAAATAAGGNAATVAAATAATTHPPQSLTPAPTPGMPVLATTAAVGRARAYPHRLLIGLPVILALKAIHQAVFARNAARPPTAQIMFEGLRFPDSPERISFDVLDQIVDGREDFFVLFLPLKVVLPGNLGPGDQHVA